MAYGPSNGHVTNDVTWPQRRCEAVRSVGFLSINPLKFNTGPRPCTKQVFWRSINFAVIQVSADRPLLSW